MSTGVVVVHAQVLVVGAVCGLATVVLTRFASSLLCVQLSEVRLLMEDVPASWHTPGGPTTDLSSALAIFVGV